LRLAVISDIHGEHFALDQVLQDIRRQGIEQIVCLGITFRHVPYDVNELVRIIRASGRPYAEESISTFLRGN
jgi:predicted phosphodiesterase